MCSVMCLYAVTSERAVTREGKRGEGSLLCATQDSDCIPDGPDPVTPCYLPHMTFHLSVECCMRKDRVVLGFVSCLISQ